jgi:transglutaminase-like putative cysteine protease
MNAPRPQLTSDELQQLKWLLGGALALFATWTVVFLEVDAWLLLILNTVAVVATVWRPTLPARVPGWMHLAAFPIIVVIFGVDLWVTTQVLPPMIRLDLMLIFYRTISYRQRRDDLQLIILGLFLVVVGGVLTVALGFAAQIAIFAACALALLFVITLVDAVEAKDPPVRTPFFTWTTSSGSPAWTHHADWGSLLRRVRAVSDWRVVTLAVVLFTGVVVLSGLLFLAIPRFQLENSLFLERLASKKARTGFSESVGFGDVTDITKDNSIALTIDVPNPRELPATLYLRMVVLERYDNARFKISGSARRAFGPENQIRKLIGNAPRRTGDPTFWTFYYEPGISRYLPLPGPFATLQFQELQNVASSNRLCAVALHSEPASMIAYRLEGVAHAAVLTDPGYAKQRTENPRAAAVQLDVPMLEDDRRALAAMVAEATGQTNARRPPTAEEFAERVRAWLWEHHNYSLQSALPAGTGDPLVRWMRSREPGHCELFAGAFVMMARTAGYPARLVTGFKGGSWNAYSNNLTIRNSDAHAWCELWNGVDAWLRVDPTPGSATTLGKEEPASEAVLARRLDRSWSARLDSLRVFWYRRVVNFDQRSQLETLRAVKSATQETGQRVRVALEKTVASLKRWLLSPWNLRRAAQTLAALAAALAAAWGLRALARSWRWRLARPVHGRRLDPVRLEAGKWLRRLSSGEPKERAGAVVGELERLRYGPPASWPEPAGVFKKARAAVRKPRVERQAVSAKR